jgi:hypothetical protein
MLRDEVQDKLNRYFAEKLEMYGATAKGVDYNSTEAQGKRFDQLVKVIDPSSYFTVTDYGSGFGAMFDFINKKGWSFEYYGLDLIEEMIVAGKEIHKAYSNCHFINSESDLPVTDYVLAGSIFNIRMDASENEWIQMITDTLYRINKLCLKGFSFNMLTEYSDRDKMRSDLFYGNPSFFFDFCKRNFSRNVALLHDYELYDFTIIVRKNS